MKIYSGGNVMSLWARFTARRKARKAERKAIADKKLQDRMEAQASLKRALALKGVDVGAMHVGYEVSGHVAYHGSSGTHCNPDVSGSCGGMGV
jgi:hypothetical protein